MTITSGSRDHQAIVARATVRTIAELRPDVSPKQADALRVLAVGLARAEHEFGAQVGGGHRIKFDIAVRELFGESMFAVAEASGPTAEAAEAALKKKFNFWEKKIVDQRIDPAGREVMEINAMSEEDAKQHLRYFGPLDATLVSLELAVAPKRGFLGIGRRRGTWKATHDAPFRATAIYRHH